MAEATNRDAAPQIVEASAVVVRDPQGRKRILIGNLWPSDHDWYPGIAIYDAQGSERVCLMLGDAGPVLSYAENGNTRMEVGHRDDAVDQAGSSFVVMVNHQGEEVWATPRHR